MQPHNPTLSLSGEVTARAETVRRMWVNYFKKGIDLGQIRLLIKQSWQRSGAYGINPNIWKAPVVHGESEVRERKRRNAELLDLLRPFMDELYEVVRGTDSVLAFADADGIVLEIFGDSEISLVAASVNFTIGVDMKEDIVGTNAIGTALALGKPIQIFAAEHYCAAWHTAHCSGAPLKDPRTGRFIGVIALIGYYRTVHPHSLALVTTAAHTVMRLIEQRRLEKEKHLLNNYFSAAVDSISDGMLIINRHGDIMRMNGIASYLLQLPQTERNADLREVGYLAPLASAIHETLQGREIISQQEICLSAEEKYMILFTTRRILVEGDSIGAVVIIKRGTKSATVTKTARHSFASMLGTDPEFLHAVRIAKKAANTDKNVLITGESGTGKEWFAQAIHNASPRMGEPFVALNCAALPYELIASELFGYEEGAFTGAAKGGRKGKFELANGGTLFLDEIGDMPLQMQAYLLRTLEEKEVMPIGARRPVTVDVRIVAATHRNLFELVKEGAFRADLFYRLHVLALEIPPLRERLSDIEYFLRRYLPQKTFTREALDVLYAHAWPGNVRELRNVANQIEVMCENDIVAAHHLPAYMHQPMPLLQAESSTEATDMLEAAEKTAIIRVLKASDSVAEAAHKLNVSPSTAYRWLRKFRIDPRLYITR